MGLSRRERREQRRKLLKEQRIHQLKMLEEQERAPEKKEEYKGLLRIYDKHYKKFLFLTLAIFILAIISIGWQVITTGDFINKGVSLKGGVVITIPADARVSIKDIESFLKTRLPGEDVEVRSITELGVQKAVMITTANREEGADKALLEALSEKIPGAKENASLEITEESLGGGFFKQTLIAMAIAFAFMAIVVFISFRTFVPSMAVIICAFADIIETVAVTNLLGLKISAGGIAAFLMLIGYSVDTDILLTTRVIRAKEGSVFQRILGAAKTGLLMTSTAIIAVAVAFFLTRSETTKELMTIVLVGLIFDIINTWLQNTAFLRMYMEHRKEKTSKAKTEQEDELEEAVEESEDVKEPETEDNFAGADEQEQLDKEEKEEKEENR